MKGRTPCIDYGIVIGNMCSVGLLLRHCSEFDSDILNCKVRGACEG